MAEQNIEDKETDYREGCGLADARSLPLAKALRAIGKLIDASNALQKPSGLTHAIGLGEQLLRQEELIPRDAVRLHFFLANAWSGLRRSQGPWAWDSHELGQEILELRKAVSHEEFPKLENRTRCPILTNLGNVLSSVGRIVEAFPLWERALASVPNFGMALANKGEAFIAYARALSWSTQRNAFLGAAATHLKGALSARTHPIEPAAVSHFRGLYRQAQEVFARIPKGHVHRPKRQTLGRDGAEKRYRLWCLHDELFLDPLNDLMQTSHAASDFSVLSASGRQHR